MNGLSVGDGFKFGCGFFLAAFIVWLIMALIVAALSLIFGAGLSGLLQNLPSPGSSLPLFGLI